jgi:hypothetical protein
MAFPLSLGRQRFGSGFCPGYRSKRSLPENFSQVFQRPDWVNRDRVGTSVTGPLIVRLQWTCAPYSAVVPRQSRKWTRRSSRCKRATCLLMHRLKQVYAFHQESSPGRELTAKRLVQDSFYDCLWLTQRRRKCLCQTVVETKEFCNTLETVRVACGSTSQTRYALAALSICCAAVRAAGVARSVSLDWRGRATIECCGP